MSRIKDALITHAEQIEKQSQKLQSLSEALYAPTESDVFDLIQVVSALAESLEFYVAGFIPAAQPTHEK